MCSALAVRRPPPPGGAWRDLDFYSDSSRNRRRHAANHRRPPLWFNAQGMVIAAGRLWTSSRPGIRILIPGFDSRPSVALCQAVLIVENPVQKWYVGKDVPAPRLEVATSQDGMLAILFTLWDKDPYPWGVLGILLQKSQFLLVNDGRPGAKRLWAVLGCSGHICCIFMWLDPPKDPQKQI